MFAMSNVLPNLHHRFALLDLAPILQETRHLDLPDIFESRTESAEYFCGNIARCELATDMLESTKFERQEAQFICQAINGFGRDRPGAKVKFVE